MGISISYILIIFGIILIPIIASIHVNNTYKKYRKVLVKSGISGFDVAKKILDNNGLNEIYVVEVAGQMSDHYDPRKKVIRLSKEVFHGTTIAACSIAAHEVGHAIQDKEGYSFMRIRAFIFPVVNFATYASYVFLILSFVFSSVNLIWIAIICMLASVVFHFVTLPVEINASKRATKELEKLKVLNSNETNGTKSMLTAAALTYVAGLVASLLEILRLVLIARNN